MQFAGNGGVYIAVVDRLAILRPGVGEWGRHVSFGRTAEVDWIWVDQWRVNQRLGYHCRL